MNQQIKTSNHELGTDTQNWVIQNFGKLVVNVLALGVGFYIFKVLLSAFVKYTL